MTEDRIRHSKPGVASFVIGIGVFIFAVLLILIAAWVVTGRNINEYENQFVILVAYYVLFFAPVMHLVGLISGICGCLQNTRKKSLAIIGILINAFFLLIQVGIHGYSGGPSLR